MRQATTAILGILAAFTLAQGCAVEATDSDSIASTEQALECNSNTGINPLKAALAVAMAEEMGEINPLKFFAWHGGQPWVDPNGKLGLSTEGENRCNQRGGCPLLKNLLSLQGSNVNNYIDQNVLNVTTLRNELYASFDRQHSTVEPHSLALLQEVMLSNSCGIHFEFSANQPGTNIPLTNTASVAGGLEFFGTTSGNDFIDFRATESTILIDPTVSLVGSLQESGTCAYGFTIYDPTWWSYGKCCSYYNWYGKWAVAPWAANTFYCKPT